jgi:hypothetical protein
MARKYLNLCGDDTRGQFNTHVRDNLYDFYVSLEKKLFFKLTKNIYKSLKKCEIYKNI